MQVKVAPRQRFRCGSSFFLVRTSPQASHEKETMFLTGLKVMCCRICRVLIGAQLHDFLPVSGCEWSSVKFVDAFCFCPSCSLGLQMAVQRLG